MSGRRRCGTGLVAWVARLGRVGWWVTGIAVGVAVLILAVGLVLPLVLPLLVMVVVAVTLRPAVDWLRQFGVPEGLAALAGAIAVPTGLVCLGVLLGRAVAAQASGWRHVMEAGGAHLRDALGADPVQTVLQSGQWRTALLGVGSALTSGTVVILQVAVGVLVGVYLLYFAFRYGPRWVGWLESRLPLPAEQVRTLLGSAALQMRRYVIGTTVVAALDALVITAGAAVLGLPFLATIAAVTFVAAYVPYLGAWVSAVFVVVVALGAGGVDAGLWMLGIVLVTQNILEGVLRPSVFGRALGLHPVVVLAVTVVGATVGGLAGVFLAPPMAAIAASWWSTTRHHGSTQG